MRKHPIAYTSRRAASWYTACFAAHRTRASSPIDQQFLPPHNFRAADELHAEASRLPTFVSRICVCDEWQEQQRVGARHAKLSTADDDSGGNESDWRRD